MGRKDRRIAVRGVQAEPDGRSILARQKELDKDKEHVFICQMGSRSALACEFAASAKFGELFNLEGGTEAWIKAGLPVE